MRFECGLAPRGAGLADEPIAQHVAVLFDEVARATEDTRALLVGGCGPGLLSLDRSGSGAGDIRCERYAEVADGVAGCRLLDVLASAAADDPA